VFLVSPISDYTYSIERFFFYVRVPWADASVRPLKKNQAIVDIMLPWQFLNRARAIRLGFERVFI